MKKINFSLVSIFSVANHEVRSAAFAKGINRDVNLANAKKITADIKKRGYRQAELIQVIPAEEAIANGDISLVDINGNAIADEDATKYYLILDGQHRVFAVSIFNSEFDQNKFQVPAIIVELGENETIAEYISAINVTKAEWTPTDYVRGAANVQKGELLSCYKDKIKCEDNPDGYPLSTLNLIFCGNAKAINKTGLSLLCQGKEQKGVKIKKNIIPAHNLKRGYRFIELCKRKGFSDKDIAKRFLIEMFLDLREGDNEEGVFKIFESITENDRKAMYNERNNLAEDKVIAQFEIIKGRMAE